MKFNKFSSRKATVLVAAGLMTMGTASTALAANGDNLVVGFLTNTATATTRLTAQIDGAAMNLRNTSGAANATALELTVASGHAPMRVNSTTKVANLNADRLDGLDATAFLGANKVRADGNHSSSSIDDFTGSGVSVAATTFTAPAAGFIMISGSVSAEDDCTLTGRGNLFYSLRVDGSNVFGGFPNEVGHWAECGVDSGNIGGSGAVTAVVPVSAGAHTVDLVLSEGGSGSFIVNRSVTSVFTPNGSGSAIGSLSSDVHVDNKPGKR